MALKADVLHKALHVLVTKSARRVVSGCLLGNYRCFDLFSLVEAAGTNFPGCPNFLVGSKRTFPVKI